MKGLLIDWGGVLTSNVFDAFAAFCGREGLPGDLVASLFRSSTPARDLLFGLEEGALSVSSFEAEFAPLLGVPAAGLVGRMMASVVPEPAMLDAVRRIRRGGTATGLVSNSWGASGYDEALLAELFDGVVISGTVGVRKPAPEIYLLGAEAIGVPPELCVFVDDLPGNLKPARALGMTTIHHVSAAGTIAALERIGILR